MLQIVPACDLKATVKSPSQRKGEEEKRAASNQQFLRMLKSNGGDSNLRSGLYVIEFVRGRRLTYLPITREEDEQADVQRTYARKISRQERSGLNIR